MYQMMDQGFVGLIFSCFIEDKNTKVLCVCVHMCVSHTHRMEKHIFAILIGWPGKVSMRRVIESGPEESEGASLVDFLGEEHSSQRK